MKKDNSITKKTKVRIKQGALKIHAKPDDVIKALFSKKGQRGQTR
jgi:hypothetical protein